MEHKLQRACEGKFKSQGGLNLPELRELALSRGAPRAESMTREELLAFLCKGEEREKTLPKLSSVKCCKKIVETKPHRFCRVKCVGDKIVKFLSKGKIKKELETREKLLRIDPDMRYTVYAEGEVVQDGYSGIIMRMGGEPLVHFFDLVEGGKEPPYPKADIIRALTHLRDFIIRMNREGLHHNDIHYDNILYMVGDRGELQLRLIDFEDAGAEKKYKHSDLDVIDRIIADFK
jgi:Lipopolysaccharide kinase (Kdo/WaaP) family